MPAGEAITTRSRATRAGKAATTLSAAPTAGEPTEPSRPGDSRPAAIIAAATSRS